MKNHGIGNKLVILVLMVSFQAFLLSVFQIYSILALYVFIACLGILVTQQVQKLLITGLINYTPQRLRKVLQTRSIFDILCDIWFLQSFTKFVKLLIAPLFLQLTPEEYREYLRENMNNEMYQAFTTKGIVNILPENISKFIAPKKLKIKKEKNQKTFQRSVSNLDQVQKIYPQAQSIIFEESTDSLLSDHPIQPKQLALKSISSEDVSKDFETQQISSLIKKNINDVQKYVKKVHFPRSVTSKDLMKTQIIGNMQKERKLSDADKDMPLNEIRQEFDKQSKSLNEKLLKVSNQIKEWDQLQVFNEISQQNNFKKKYQSKLHYLFQISKLYSMMKIVNTKTLFKGFILGSTTLAIQLYIHGKTRRWVKETINVIVYVIGLILSTTSFGILTYKYLKYLSSKTIKENPDQKFIQRKEEKKNTRTK